MQNTCTIHREHWQLCLNQLERNLLFEGLDAEDNDPPKQHDNDVKEAFVATSTSFAPSTNVEKTEPSR